MQTVAINCLRHKMRKDRTKAEQMRRAGKSYKKIHKQLGIPIATLSDWFRNAPWSIEIKNKLAEESSFSSPEKLKLLIASNKERWFQWHKKYENEAIEEFTNLKNNSLFVAGLMLYWGEGTKRGHAMRLSNSEPEMIRVFHSFLVLIGIPKEKIFVSLLLYPDLIDSVQKNFWGKAVGIPLSQFKKSITIIGRHPTRRLSYGVCTIQVYSSGLKTKIMTWIEMCKNFLLLSNSSGE